MSKLFRSIWNRDLSTWEIDISSGVIHRSSHGDRVTECSFLAIDSSRLDRDVTCKNMRMCQSPHPPLAINTSVQPKALLYPHQTSLCANRSKLFYAVDVGFSADYRSTMLRLAPCWVPPCIRRTWGNSVSSLFLLAYMVVEQWSMNFHKSSLDTRIADAMR